MSSNAITNAPADIALAIATSLARTAELLAAALAPTIPASLAAPAPTPVPTPVVEPKAAKAPKASKAKADAPAFLKRTPEEKAAIKAANAQLAAWMREHGISPTGNAWTDAKLGERNVKVLLDHNAVQGITLKADAPEAIVAEVVAEAPSTKSPKRVQAGKTVAATRARDAKGRLLPKTATDPRVEALVAGGHFTREQAVLALSFAEQSA